MRLFTASAAALAALALTAGAAAAQDVSFNIGAVTDYAFRGISQTNEDPAIQGGVDATFGSFYAGAWASNVDFGDSTDAEVDLYGGYRTEAAGFAFDVGVIGYFYPGEPGDADWTYYEAKVAASRAFGPATIGVAAYYSPDFTGPVEDDSALYYELNGSFSPIEKVTVSGAVGEQTVEDADDYTTWNLGATIAITDNVAADIRYWDTDIDAVDIAEERLVAGLKFTF